MDNMYHYQNIDYSGHGHGASLSDSALYSAQSSGMPTPNTGSPNYPTSHLPGGGSNNSSPTSLVPPGYISAPAHQQRVINSGVTGHVHASSRRHSPPQLLPMDAPTQPRSYTSASSTSRKEIPSYFLSQARRHSRASSHMPSGQGASDEDLEDDELIEEPPSANATDQEKIEYKRRQNTLAARRSRKRKLLYQQQLEMTVERLTMEKEIWKTRALTLKQLLESHRIPCPDFRD